MATRFTRAELLVQARRHGYDVGPKLVERWVTLGLLDQAETVGRSRGQGVGRYWSDNQRRLFLTILDKHRQANSMRALTNIPVLIWAIWGEDHVPLRQVRRCLETFAQVRKERPNFGGEHWAAELVGRLARPGSSGYTKQALVDSLLRSAAAGELEETELRRLFIEAVGPAEPGAQVDGPRAFHIVAAQWAALTRYDELTDPYFRWARAFYLYGQHNYASVRFELAADPRFGRLHDSFDLKTIANRASHDMLFILGLALLSPPGPDTPDPLRLEPWLEGRARLVVETDERLSVLLLPRGVPNARLGIHARIDITART